MTAHRAVLAAALAFIALIAFLTVADTVENGFTIRTVISIPIVVLLAVGVIGALAQPPRDR